MYNEKTYQPIDNMVLVQLDESSDVTDAGIILPTTVTAENEQLGTVVRVGRGYNSIAGITPCNVQPEDRVLLRKKSGNKLEFLPSDYIVIKDANLMGIILPEPVKEKFISITKIDKNETGAKTLKS